MTSSFFFFYRKLTYPWALALPTVHRRFISAVISIRSSHITSSDVNYLISAPRLLDKVQIQLACCRFGTIATCCESSARPQVFCLSAFHQSMKGFPSSYRQHELDSTDRERNFLSRTKKRAVILLLLRELNWEQSHMKTNPLHSLPSTVHCYSRARGGDGCTALVRTMWELKSFGKSSQSFQKKI